MLLRAQAGTGLTQAGYFVLLPPALWITNRDKREAWEPGIFFQLAGPSPMLAVSSSLSGPDFIGYLVARLDACRLNLRQPAGLAGLPRAPGRPWRVARFAPERRWPRDAILARRRHRAMPLHHICVTSGDWLSLPRPASIRPHSTIRIAIQLSVPTREGRGWRDAAGRRRSPMWWWLTMHDPGKLG